MNICTLNSNKTLAIILAMSLKWKDYDRYGDLFSSFEESATSDSSDKSYTSRDRISSQTLDYSDITEFDTGRYGSIQELSDRDIELKVQTLDFREIQWLHIYWYGDDEGDDNENDSEDAQLSFCDMCMLCKYLNDSDDTIPHNNNAIEDIEVEILAFEDLESLLS